MSRVRTLSTLLALVAGAIAFEAPAGQAEAPAPLVRGGSSGHWFNPEQDGHGIHIEVNPGGRALVVWYAYDDDGRARWIFGSGRVQGNVIEAEMSSLQGGRPPAAWDHASVAASDWGSVRIQVLECDRGSFAWRSDEPAFGEGEMPIARLSAVDGTRCQAEEEFGVQHFYSFERGMLDFEEVFVDFPVGMKTEWGIEAAWDDLPDALPGRKGIRLAGTNRSDDLAMLVKAPIRGLRPDSDDDVEIEMDLASNVRHGCVGVGGPPGEAVVVKLGASTVEPLPLKIVEAGDVAYWRLNIDIGQQHGDGPQGVTVGNIATSHACELGAEGPWELKNFTTRGTHRFRVRTDAGGTLWVIGGTDSGFEGRTEVYVTGFRVRMDPHDIPL